MSRPDIEARALDYLTDHLEQMTEWADERLRQTGVTKVTFPIVLDGVVDQLTYDGKTWRFTYSLSVGPVSKVPGMAEGSVYCDDVKLMTVDLMEVTP